MNFVYIFIRPFGVISLPPRKEIYLKNNPKVSNKQHKFSSKIASGMYFCYINNESKFYYAEAIWMKSQKRHIQNAYWKI
jgi:hypothetical protein